MVKLFVVGEMRAVSRRPCDSRWIKRRSVNLNGRFQSSDAGRPFWATSPRFRGHAGRLYLPQLQVQHAGNAVECVRSQPLLPLQESLDRDRGNPGRDGELLVADAAAIDESTNLVR